MIVREEISLFLLHLSKIQPPEPPITIDATIIFIATIYNFHHHHHDPLQPPLLEKLEIAFLHISSLTAHPLTLNLST